MSDHITNYFPELPSDQLPNHIDENSLFEAISDGNLPIVNYLLENGVAINSIDPHGYPVLIQVVKAQNLSLLEFILQKNIDDINVADSDGRTSLHHCVLLNNLALANLLLSYQADPFHLTSKLPISATTLSVAFNNSSLFSTFLQKINDQANKPSLLNDYYFISILNNHIHILDILFKIYPELFGKPFSTNQITTFLKTLNPSDPGQELLLKYFNDYYTDDSDLEVILKDITIEFIATALSHSSFFTFLEERNILKKKELSFYGETLLHWSAIIGNTEITNLLLKKKFSPKKKNLLKLTPADLLEKYRHSFNQRTILKKFRSYKES